MRRSNRAGCDYLRRIDSFITHLKAQGPARTCDESKEEEEEEVTEVMNRQRVTILDVMSIDSRLLPRPPPDIPTVGPCPGPYGGPRVGCCF